MAEKKTKRKTKQVAPQPTVLHDSSADNAQNIGLGNELNQEKNDKKPSAHRRKHSGSDGADQERGSNH